MTEKRFNPDQAHVLMSDERKALLPPNKVIEHLDLRSEDIVADLGAGNGYFTIPIAKNTKSVYAVDIEKKMLGMLKEYATKERTENINYVVSDLEDINLNDESVNKVIISFVIHEVSNVNGAIGEIKRILKRRGKLLLIEWERIKTETGPPLHERIPSNNMVELLEQNGFDTEIIRLNPANYAVKATLR